VLLLNDEGRLMAHGPPREVFSKYHSAIDTWGVWLPQVSELALHLDHNPDVELPLRLDEAIEHFKQRLPLIAATPVEPSGTRPLHAPGARAFVVNRLSYTYPKREVAALDEVSLSVPAGDFLALLGPNGAGKTTLAAHLAGILKAEPGTVQLFGFDANDLSVADVAERVSYVFQNPEHQFLTERVEDEVAYSPRARQGRGRRPHVTVEQRVEEVLAQLGLDALAAANPFTLSYGQQRRLSTGAMVAAAPRLLIVDEPTLGQDRRTTRGLMDLLRNLNRGGMTIVLITQDMRLAASATRNAALLIDGKLTYHGPTRALFREDVLLVQAGLWPPELFDLSLALQRWQADFPVLMTVDDYLTAFEGQNT
jgi:energy-coupling factor transport system ATP-binding protein